MYRKLVLLFALLLYTCALFAQGKSKRAVVTGRVVDKTALIPLTDVQVILLRAKQLTVTNDSGQFRFEDVRYGTYTLIVSKDNFVTDTIRFKVDQGDVDLGPLGLGILPGLQTIAIPPDEQAPADDADAVANTNTNSLLSAQRDPFANTASFSWGMYGFKVRGYNPGEQQVYVDGAPMDIDINTFYWDQVGGLTDIFRGRRTTYGLQRSDEFYGGLAGSVSYDISASRQRRQKRITTSFTNRDYRNRLMLTYSSGLLKNGWAFSASFIKRWSKNGYAPGTFYDGYAYYAAASKKIGNKHLVNLVSFGTPVRQGLRLASYGEAYELTGSNFYNPGFGHTNGEQKSAQINAIFQPTTILNYEYNTDNNLKWSTALSYQFGKNKTSSLDWNNAPVPYKDYYAYLPGYFLQLNTPDAVAAQNAKADFVNNPQIAWDSIVVMNAGNVRPIPNAAGTPSGSLARQSIYVLGNDVTNTRRWTLTTNLQKSVGNNMALAGGFNCTNVYTEAYREMADLLGGNFYLDVTSFTDPARGITSVHQNNLDQPNRVVKAADKYLYDYIIRDRKGWAWAQAGFTYSKLDFFLAGNYGFQSFQREGLFRNGLYPTDYASSGKSERQMFAIYGIKGGVTYKLNGRNFIMVNSALSADAPSSENVFFDARERNTTIDEPVVQRNYSLEGSYVYRAPKLKGRLTGYFTNIIDAVERRSYYYTGSGTSNATVDFVMEHIRKKHAGVELSVEYKAHQMLTATLAASVAKSVYANNPVVTMHFTGTDDHPQIITAYLNDYNLSTGPQTAAFLGFNYSSKRHFYANISCSYFDRNFIELAPSRRLTEQMQAAQEKFPSAFVADVSLYKSWMLRKIIKAAPKGTYLAASIGINNILDNRNIVVSGFENLHYDYTGTDAGRFASKYLYAFGRTYFVNLSLRF